MPDHSAYRQLLSQARDLARMSIDPAEAHAATDLVRSRLGEDLHRRRMHYRKRVLIVAGGIAASIALFCLVTVLFSTFTPSANAAEQLQAVAQTMQAYKGWVHVTPAPYPATEPSAEPTIRSLHIDTTDGTTAIVFGIGGKLCVRFARPGAGQELIYSEATGEVQAMPLPTEPAAYSMVRRSAELPLKLADVLEQLKARGMRPPTISESADGGLRRFELTWADDPKTVPESYRDLVASKFIIWTDPQTQLIRRIQTSINSRPTTLEYSYGKPVIRDIYDLNVPRTARLVELRPTTRNARPPVFTLPPTTQLTQDNLGDLKAIATRLSQRRSGSFGDGVMIECTEQMDLHPHHGREGRITILARQGDRGLNASYLVAPAMAFLGGPRFPDGWPLPTMQSALATLKPAAPVQARVFNGDNSWEVKLGPSGRLNDVTVTPTTQTVASLRNFHLNPFAWLWPTINTDSRATLMQTTATLLRDPTRPKLIVVQQETTVPKFGHSKAIYWLDPDHDDLLVEQVTHTNMGSPGGPETVIHEICLDFARLPDGRWYPAHGQTKVFHAPTTRPVRDDGYTESWRQIMPGSTIEDDWYSDPAERVKAAIGRFSTTLPHSGSQVTFPGQ